MIHILLLVLKVIGIILLVVLCLALLILFFPITYVGNVNVKDKLVYGKLKAGWLFHIIHFGMKFEKSDVFCVLRVFGIPVFSTKKKNVVSDSETYRNQSLSEEEKIITSEKQTEVKSKNETEVEPENKTNVEQESETKTSKKSIIEKIKELFDTIKIKVLDILKKIKEYCRKAKEIKEFITANTTKEAYNYAKKIIIKLFKHIIPKKIRGKVLLGFDEPHITGQTLGYIAMGFSMFHINPRHIVIESDFEKKVLVGNVKFKGRIVLGVVFYYILKLYFKKEINDIIRKFK